MTCKVDSTALIWLLEQLAAVQRAFCDERVVVLLAKVARCVQPARNNANSLELRSRIADGLLIDRESLGEVFVRDFLKVVLVCDLATRDKEA
jgi:hypothetical protein